MSADAPRPLRVHHRPIRVVVVGGGAAGTLVAAHLLRRARPEDPVEVRIIERSDVVGPGLAHGAADPHHLLNNTATRLSAYPDDPDHLLRWCQQQGLAADRGAFLPRRTFGRYLAGLLGEVPETPWRRSIRVRGEAVRIEAGGSVRPAEQCG